MKTAIDIWNDHLMISAVDPRPINTGDGAAIFIQYLIHAGYLPKDIGGDQFAHLRQKIDGYIYDAVLNDRKDRIGMTNTDKP